MKTFISVAIFASLILILACSDSTAPEDSNSNTNNSNIDLSGLSAYFSDEVTVYTDGNFIVLESNGVPNHPSPYFNSTDSRYETYNGNNTNFRLNPNRIAEQDLVLRIPLNPAEASSHQSTSLGPIGMAINGVPLYNQYAAGNQPLTFEIDSFDQYNGHPQQMGGYHYHIEPLYLTDLNGRSSLIGFLLDGFPVYGPEEDGASVLNDDLDDYHGHSHATPEFPDGIYHYHITSDAPYINGGQYFGTPGTVSF